MKRFHVHLHVADLEAGIRFYSTLFAADPAVRKPDYAKWMLDDPRLNFAISDTGRSAGIDHLGIQVDEASGLAEFGERLDAAGGTLVPQHAEVCCYARSDKLWTEDPQGTRWEVFHTIGEATTYHAGRSACATDGAACTPTVSAMQPKVDRAGPCCVAGSGCC